jgi:8-oxo-dGTP pyrophosphatase MutT (NUDIX family)/phosphohistidine phosphatase SixA
LNVEASIHAAGGIVWRYRDDALEFLVVHRPRYDDWSFPKGKHEPHEAFIDTAIREVGEEAGIRVAVGKPIATVTYTVGTETKDVHYWLMSYVAEAPELRDNEVDEVRWCALDAANELLTHDDDRALLTAATQMLHPHHVWVIRHARAEKRSTWEGDDDLRPLTEVGEHQTSSIVSYLEKYPIGHVVSSPALRCIQTAQPLAEQLDLDVQIDDQLAEGNSFSNIVRWYFVDDSVAIVTHGDIVEALVEKLLQDELVPADARDWHAKGAIWDLMIVARRCVSASYHPIA